MKKFIVLLVLSTLALPSFAQVLDTRRKIEVYGNAEEEVIPDILYLTISLKEYFKDNNNKNKISISVLEKQLSNAVNKAGIKPEDFTIDNVSAYNFSQTQKKQKDPGFLASKQYRIKVSNLNSFNQIISSVDEKGIQSTRITGYDHSNMNEIRNRLRTKAIQQAKQKASVLVDAIDEKLGKVIEINDNNSDAGDIAQPIQRQAMFKASSEAMMDEGELDIDFKKIKLNYQIRTVFELL